MEERADLTRQLNWRQIL